MEQQKAKQMIIHFSSSFGYDYVYAPIPNTEKIVLGNVYLGTRGLLEFLETHLGLYQKENHNALRIANYEQAINKSLVEHPDLYIQKSFAVDSWGVAQKLLALRDELVFAGFEFNTKQVISISKRLHVLSVIEEHVNGMPKGEADRWIFLLEHISTVKELPVTEVKIYEPKDFLHPFFVDLFQKLESKSVNVTWVNFEYDLDNSDLGNFKRKLLNPDCEKVTLVDDGSLIVLRASNDFILSECIGEYLVMASDLNPLLIIPDRGELLEEAIISRGLPAIGYRGVESDGTIEQLLHLITVFLWNPIHPNKLLQYLLHPIAPISKSLRLDLATTFAKKSSIKSNEWQDTIDKHFEKWSDSASTNQKALKKWFDRPKASLEDGAGIDQIISIYTDLSNWAGTLSSMEKRSAYERRVFQELVNQCNQLISVVKTFEGKGEKISEQQLNKWIEAIDIEYSSVQNIREIGSCTYISKPSNLTSKSNATLWWNFVNETNPVKYATDWSREELELLTGKNIHYKSSIINQWFWQQCHAILMTNKKLVLCLPESVNGDVKEAHPLYYDLQQAFINPDVIEKSISLSESTQIDDRAIELINYPQKDLPSVSTHWQFSLDKQLTNREHESYSSLIKLFYYPHDYLLNYQLGIRPVDIDNIEVSNKLFGNLVHSAVHQLWSDTNILKYPPDERSRRIGEQLEITIKEEGSILLLPEHELSLSQFRLIANKSIVKLFKDIKANDWTFVESEEHHKTIDEIGIQGDIDLVLRRGQNEYVIVDLKWGGFKAKREELINEQELQLIIYNRLLSAKGRTIHLCYYIISEQIFLARSNIAFQNATVIKSNKSIESHNQMLWNKMMDTYNLRYKELNNGTAELGIELPFSELEGISEIWTDKTGKYLKVPKNGKNKKADNYSPYSKIVGRI